MFGPSLAGFTMSAIGAPGFFVFLGGVHTIIGGFGLYRMIRTRAPAADDAKRYVLFPLRSSPQVTALSHTLAGDRATTHPMQSSQDSEAR